MMEKRLEKIENRIDDIVDNHLHHLESDMASTKTNVSWIMKIQWGVMSAAIGGLVVGVINLL